MSAASGSRRVVTYFLIVGELALHAGIVILQFGDATENFRQIERLDRDAVGFEKLLAVAHGVERRRAARRCCRRADCAARSLRGRPPQTTPDRSENPANPELTVCSLVRE